MDATCLDFALDHPEYPAEARRPLLVAVVRAHSRIVLRDAACDVSSSRAVLLVLSLRPVAGTVCALLAQVA